MIPSDVILVTWNPREDLRNIFPEKTAQILAGMVPVRGILKDYGENGGLMSCLMPGGKLAQIPVRLDEITEVRLS